MQTPSRSNFHMILLNDLFYFILFTATVTDSNKGSS